MRVLVENVAFTRARSPREQAFAATKYCRAESLFPSGFDRCEFKFRPKRSDFGRKKLRTAETAVGFRLSEVVLSPGRRGGKLGGLQQALRRTRFLPIQG